MAPFVVMHSPAERAASFISQSASLALSKPSNMRFITLSTLALSEYGIKMRNSSPPSLQAAKVSFSVSLARRLPISLSALSPAL